MWRHELTDILVTIDCSSSTGSKAPFVNQFPNRQELYETQNYKSHQFRMQDSTDSDSGWQITAFSAAHLDGFDELLSSYHHYGMTSEAQRTWKSQQQRWKFSEYLRYNHIRLLDWLWFKLQTCLIDVKAFTKKEEISSTSLSKNTIDHWK